MDCPRCQVELVENHCPKCGYQLPVERPTGESQKKSDTGQGPIGFSVATASEKPRSKDINWRSELKRKLDRHRKTAPPQPSAGKPAGKVKKPAPASSGSSKRQPSPPADPAKKAEGKAPDPSVEKEIVRQLFRYRMGEKPAQPQERIVSFRQKDNPTTVGAASGSEKPLIRKSLKSRRQTNAGPGGSDLLPLKKLAESPTTTSVTVPGPETTQAATGGEVSSEILLSRFLSGIIDLGLAGLGGVICALVASAIVGVPYYSPDVLGLVIFCAILLFFINSVFFLVLLAKTPGMMWTDLRLVEEEQEHPTPGAVLLRTLLFLPLAASVVGLLWALFDEQKRCWHDQLSGTKVVADPQN